LAAPDRLAACSVVDFTTVWPVRLMAGWFFTKPPDSYRFKRTASGLNAPLVCDMS
jgi:hypothetical protein